jgi:hypothetical protein
MLEKTKISILKIKLMNFKEELYKWYDGTITKKKEENKCFTSFHFSKI